MDRIANPKLKELVFKGPGIAFHHAGITADDRAIIEKLFLDGQVRILCCTSTLSGERGTLSHTVQR